jgi:hypothetical protein
VLEAAREASPPAYLVATPFLIAFLFVGVAQLATRLVGRWLEEFVKQQLASVPEDSRTTLLEVLPSGIREGTLRQRLEWSVDLVVAFSTIVPPIIGLLALIPNGLGAYAVLLLGLSTVSAIVLIILVIGTEPGKYEAWGRPRGKKWTLSLVTLVGLTANGSCAVAAVAIALTHQ